MYGRNRGYDIPMHERADMAKRNIKGEIISPGVAKGKLCFINFKMEPFSPKNNFSCSEIAKEIARFEYE